MKTIICSLIAALGCTGALNGQEFLSDPNQFSVPTRLLDFEMYPDGSRVPGYSFARSNAWQDAGVLIIRREGGAWAVPSDYFAHIPPHSGGISLSGNDGYVGRDSGFIGFQFVLPGTTNPVAMTEVGIWVQHYVPPNPSTVRPKPLIGFYDGEGNEIGVFVVREEDEFFGMRYSGGIGAIFVGFDGSLEDTGYFTVDDLQFGPAPAPTVATERTRGGKIVATWPAFYGAYQLQVTHHVNQRKPENTKWKDVSNTPILIEDMLCLTNRIGKGRFFRIVPP